MRQTIRDWAWMRIRVAQLEIQDLMLRVPYGHPLSPQWRPPHLPQITDEMIDAWIRVHPFAQPFQIGW